MQLVQEYYDVQIAQLGISVEQGTQSSADRINIILAELQSVHTDLELHSRQFGIKLEQMSQPLPPTFNAYDALRQLRHILFPWQVGQKLIVVVHSTQVKFVLI